MKVNNITVESTDKVMSSHSGLFFFEKLWTELKLDKKLSRLLPRKQRKKGMPQVKKFKGILYSFAVGNDCIDDLDNLRTDKLFTGILGGELPARTAGDFLVKFSNRKVEMIGDVLFEVALAIRTAVFNDKKFILSMDATPHKQSGKKMEKLGKNYKGIWGLDSQNAYDQYGLSYLFDLRSGGTHSGKGSELWIHKIFSKIPEWMERYFRADSAYGKWKVLEQLHLKKAKYTIVLRENIAKYVRKKNRDFLKWRETDLEFFDSNECEIASAYYPVKKLGDIRVVFIRVRKSDEEIVKQLDLLERAYDPEEDDYKYYSIITNFPKEEMTEEEVIDWYRGRANCENYIKEQKYGFDFLHFPCKSFDANRTWGLIGTFAHNMTRYLSFCMDQKVKRVRNKRSKEVETITQLGYFAKKVRNVLINIPGQVIRTARTIKLKINYETVEVLEKVMLKINEKFSLEKTFT